MTDLIWTPVKIRLGQIKLWSQNPRMSTKAQAQRLIKSERELGQPQTLAVSPFIDGFCDLYDGHQRVAAWNTIKGADFEVWALQSNRPLTDDERRKISVLLHTASGQWEWDKLASWSAADLQEWGFDRETLQSWNNDANNLKEMLEAGEEESVDAEPQIDRAAELQEKWQVKTGDLFAVGSHRLLCGDSTKREDVERVMGGGKINLMWTDPPYGVKYGDKMEEANPMGYRVRQIENDDLPAEELEAFIRLSLSNAAEFSVAGAGIYMACPPGTPLPALISSFTGSGFDFRWGLVWLKDQIVLSRADYHFKHENILYGWKGDGAHYFTEDRTQSSVFEYPRPKKSDEHPTMKPVALIQHMIRNSSMQGEIVYDAFGGSGSTMIASENEGRKCRMIELSTAFTSVVLERMATAFPHLEIKRLDT